MHAAKGRYSAKFRENLSNGLLALVYTHEMYPLYGIYICLHVHVWFTHSQDLQRRLEDAGNRERAKDEEMSDLKGRLRDAESQARQAQPDIDAKQREIEVRLNK